MAKGTVATKYPIDLTGLRFGKLIVIGKGENYCSPKGSIASQWYCQCDCGSEPVLLRRDSLTTGNTRSCGCLHEEVFVTHHGGGTRLYQTYRNMLRRCYDKNCKAYKFYGAKGINVCDEWKKDFLVFKQWAEITGYNDMLTIERVNVKDNYCPENCRWATRKEQANNTNRNRFLSYKNYSFTVSIWAEKMHIKYTTLLRYANYYGDNKAIEVVLEKYAPNHTDFIMPTELLKEDLNEKDNL